MQRGTIAYHARRTLATVKHALHRLRWLRVPAIVVGAVLLPLVGAAVVFDVSTASPAFCASCHEMDVRAESWSSSAHNVVACVECHEEPTEWYQLPQRVTARARLLKRDRAAQDAAYASTLATATAPAEPLPVPDEVCLQCHDPNRKATSGFRILIDHVEHAKRNGSCVSCHVSTAHPLPGRSTPMSLMTQCFTCHGTEEQPEARATCATCHPAGYQLRPGSHTAEWQTAHSAVAKADPKQCMMCHDRQLCDDCHGLEMPHPAEWATADTGHAARAAIDPFVCERCHGSYPDLCTSCHHTAYRPQAGGWVDQHPAEVIATGREACLTCHETRTCGFCHTRLVE